ncbi:nuclease [Linderina macrospora]|uniref:Nuclease n=1 Tax=Linderina macrospora TaxID=4868 RepID=A0ACC1JCW8_9FUNG|nr:nuclease [Linderina macrospora]
MRATLVLTLSALALTTLTSAGPVQVRQSPPDDILKYGNPAPVSDQRIRSRYAIAYNRALRIPHWSAEHLNVANLQGTADRTDIPFSEDTSLPEPFRALLKDYVSSGYDRGHMCPAADAKVNMDALTETFLLSNIAPQVGVGFNRHYWAYLESFVRDLTKQFDDVYVVTGSLFLPTKDAATGKWRVTYEVIGNPPNVAVPTHFFKVILGVTGGSNFALGGFALPNQKIDSKTELTTFSQPLEFIEKASGLTFFDKVDRSAATELCKTITCKLTA